MTVHIWRRQALAGMATLILPPVFIAAGSESAEASIFDGLANVFKGVGSTLLQGVNVATHAIDDVVKSGVKVVSQVAGAAPAIGNDLIQLQSTFNGYATSALNQVLPLFCNPTSNATPLQFGSDMSAQPYSLGPNDEDFLYQDPAGFMTANAQRIAGQIPFSGDNFGIHQIVVPGGTLNPQGTTAPYYMPYQIGMGTMPSAQGFYPAGASFSGQGGVNIGTLLTLISLLA